MSAYSVSLRIAFFYAVLFFGLGVMLPFLPVWLTGRGFSIEQVGYLLALQSVSRVLATPWISYAADRAGNLKRALLYCSVVSALGVTGMSLAFGFSAMAVAIVVTYGAFSAVLPVIEAYAVAQAEQIGADYGRLRLWGSLTFIAGSLGAGLALDVVDVAWLIYILIGSHVVLIVAAALLPRDVRPVSAPAHAGVLQGLGEAREHVLSRVFVLFMLAAGLTQASHAVYYAFGSVHWQTLGYDGTTIGVFWSIGVVAEVVLFTWSGRVVRFFGPVMLILVGSLAGVVRWGLIAADPAVTSVVLLQALHALTFGATHLGTMFYIRQSVPVHLAATAQGIYSALSGGIIMTAIMAASGQAYRDFEGGAYLFMAGLCGLAVLLSFILSRISPTRRAAVDA